MKKRCVHFVEVPNVGYECLCTKCGGFRVRCGLERCPYFKPTLFHRLQKWWDWLFYSTRKY